MYAGVFKHNHRLNLHWENRLAYPNFSSYFPVNLSLKFYSIDPYKCTDSQLHNFLSELACKIIIIVWICKQTSLSKFLCKFCHESLCKVLSCIPRKFHPKCIQSVVYGLGFFKHKSPKCDASVVKLKYPYLASSLSLNCIMIYP